VILILSPVFGQNQAGLSLKDIMKGTDFTGTPPSGIYWSEDGKNIYFDWNPEKKLVSGLYKYSISSGKITAISPEIQASLPSASGKYNSLHTKKVYSKNGDIYILDIPSGHVSQITNTIIAETNPMFLNGGTRIVYEAGNNIFLWNIETGFTKQLTNIIIGKEKKEQEPTEQKSCLENDRIDFLDVLSYKKELKNVNDSLQDILKPKRPEKFYLEGQSISNLTTSPDCRFISFRVTKASSGDHTTKVLDYVTESGYSSIKKSQTKGGEPRIRMLFLHL